MKKLLLLLIFLYTGTAFSQKLIIVEQDFNQALRTAANEKKLLFIDFYTDWCAPCKKLDKWIFRNDSISSILANDFVLLRYNAEKDTTFNLTKKYHVNSYPTGIILNNKGYVLNRKYGFPGDSVQETSQIVFTFTNEAISLDKRNLFLKGYSNNISISGYPKFYIDFINRTKTSVVDNKEFANYWRKKHDVLSEQYFSTLAYFAADVPENTHASFLKNKEKYAQLFGETEVNVILFFFVAKKFEAAIKNNSQSEFNEAKEFSIRALGDKGSKEILPLFETRFNESKNK